MFCFYSTKQATPAKFTLKYDSNVKVYIFELEEKADFPAEKKIYDKTAYENIIR